MCHIYNFFSLVVPKLHILCVYRDEDEIDERATCERTLRQRLQHNRGVHVWEVMYNDNHCNSGNVNNNDPCAKIILCPHVFNATVHV